MIVTACPHCRQPLHIDPSYAGEALQCPRCFGGLIAPRDPSVGSAASSAQWDLGSAVTWLKSTAKQVAGAIEPQLKAAQEAFRGRPQDTRTEQVRSNSDSDEFTDIEVVDEPNERQALPNREASKPAVQAPVVSPPRPHVPPPTVVELRFANTGVAPRSNEPIPRTPPQTYGPNQRVSVASLNSAGARLSPSGVGFYGRGTALPLGKVSIAEPLVYATGVPNHGTFDASLIDGSLPVATFVDRTVEELPYWPSYHLATPAQRACYLNWLAGGRCDPHVEIGYVFIYFYGLERRILVDAMEHPVIAEEVLRLLSIYHSNRSFRRYSTSLLWLILALMGQANRFNEDLLAKVVAATDRWDEECLGHCLAYVAASNSPLSPELAFIATRSDRRTPSSVITRRHENLFRDLFLAKYKRQFGAGLKLRASQRAKPVHYRPASGTLSRSLAERNASISTTLPDVLAVSSQFKPLIDLWNECIDELRAYDKAHRAGVGETTARAYESLPEELRTGDHPEFDTWFETWTKHANAEGVPVVPIGSLGTLKGFAETGTLSKKQANELLNTADCLGIGIEPDARLTGRNYRWDDRVTMFFLEDGPDQEPAAYQAASMLLQLGLVIADADGIIEEEELVHISRHLEQQFDLTPVQAKRLEALRNFSLATETRNERSIVATLRKRLTPAQRLLVGEFLVGVAASNQQIPESEVTTLKRLFRDLDVPESHLAALLVPFQVSEPTGDSKDLPETTAEPVFQLDLEAISRILRDTRSVAITLQEAMALDDESDDLCQPELRSTEVAFSVAPDEHRPVVGVAVPQTASMQHSGPGDLISLPDRFVPFFEALTRRDAWSESEAKQLARTHGVMLGGAVEAINEWAHSRWNVSLIEDGDPLCVRRELLAEV